jgi:hypothetical protein
MRKVLLVTAALVVAVFFFVLATLPPRQRGVPATIDPDLQRRTIGGAYHVHSTRSDGAGSKDAIAAAASRAGLAFVILTDHGDGMRPPDPPEYLHGVLCVDAVEISTTGGHYVALHLNPAPYPLGGEPSAVVEDVHRLGGFGIAAHPDSPRAELAWGDWSAPMDGIEWLSADSEWRDENRTTIARVLLSYPFRPAPALASMLDRPVATLRRWDALAATRPVVGLAAHDAHGGIGRGIEEGGVRRRALGGIPSYEASFRTFSNRVILDAPLTGDAHDDAHRILDAIEHGRVFTVVDAIATPGFIDLRGADGVSAGQMGSVLQAGSNSVTFDATMPGGSRLLAAQAGREIELPSGPGAGHSYASEPGAITGPTRFEIHVPGAPGTPPVPWLVSNPIYFLPKRVDAVPPTEDVATFPLPPDATWHVEKDPRSTGVLSSSGDRVTLDFSLGAGERASQFAALALDLHAPVERFSIVRMTASTKQPARVSIQLRYPQDGGQRWGSSRYVDSSPRDLSVPVDRMRPLDRQTDPLPDPASATALLVVVDLTNARPGDSNVVYLRNVRFAR